MMQHLWKTAGILAAAVLCLTAAPLTCKAAETYSYTLLDDGTASLQCEDASLVHADIPAEIDGHTVTGLAESCFDGCTSLETVTIPDTVTEIHSYAFQNCELLEIVEIPANVTKIDDFVFEGCIHLKEIRVSPENESYFDTDGILYKKQDSWTLMRYPAAKPEESFSVPSQCGTIAPWAFTGCRYLQEVNLDSVQAIGADAFMNCDALKKVKIGENVDELIGAGFAYCTSLEKVTLPKGMKIIGDRCFFGDASLREINFPDGLSSVGQQAFFACVSLKTLELPASLQTIGENAFGYSVDENNAVAKIPDVVFEVPFNSAAYNYARKNGFSFHSEAPQTLILLVIVGAVLAVLLCVGLSVEMKRRRAEKAAAAEQEALERRRQAHAERMEKKKQKKPNA